MTLDAPVFPSLIDPEVQADPVAHYARLRREAPVLRDPRMGAYVVTTYDAVWSAYRDTRFSTRGYQATLETIHGRTVLSLDGLEHAKNRALLTPHFRGRALEELEVHVRRSAARVLGEIIPRRAASLGAELEAAIRGEGQVDLAARFSRRFPVSVIAEMLGLPDSDHDQFSEWYSHLMAFVTNYAADPDVDARGIAVKQHLADYLLPLIAERRAHPGGTDLISAIVESEVDGYRMDDDEVRGYASLLLTAGGDTTDRAFSSLCRNLLMNDMWGIVRDDRSLVTAAIAETLRFSPPAQMTTRLAEEDVELAGVVIPQGSIVYLVGASANRDASRYVQPDTFRIDRDDLAHDRAFSGAANHMSFGSGRHFCIGAMLARTEMDIALNLLLDTLPHLRLAPGAPTHDVGLRSRGPHSVVVQLDS